MYVVWIWVKMDGSLFYFLYRGNEGCWSLLVWVYLEMLLGGGGSRVWIWVMLYLVSVCRL